MKIWMGKKCDESWCLQKSFGSTSGSTRCYLCKQCCSDACNADHGSMVQWSEHKVVQCITGVAVLASTTVEFLRGY